MAQAEQAREPHIRLLLALGALVEGSFVRLGRKCGKANCRCAAGELHEGHFLSRSQDGRSSLTYVRRADEGEVETKAGSYRQLRQARAELMKLAARTAEFIDELQQALAEPYPPEGAEPRRRKKKTTTSGGKS